MCYITKTFYISNVFKYNQDFKACSSFFRKLQWNDSRPLIMDKSLTILKRSNIIRYFNNDNINVLRKNMKKSEMNTEIPVFPVCHGYHHHITTVPELSSATLLRSGRKTRVLARAQYPPLLQTRTQAWTSWGSDASSPSSPAPAASRHVAPSLARASVAPGDTLRPRLALALDLDSAQCWHLSYLATTRWPWKKFEHEHELAKI